ncbi:MAG TPA: PA2779 family protein [Terriglobales bacterium]|nr:PA2779 family protein [Terriglobales bacterium]
MFVRSECIRKFAACFLVVLFTLPLTLAQTTHVVSPADLQKQTVATSQARQQNLQKVRDFLANPAATETLKKAHIDTEQVKKAVSQLDNQELAQLASRADKAQHDFAAGYLSTLDIALIILGIALIILIIVVAK